MRIIYQVLFILILLNTSLYSSEHDTLVGWKFSFGGGLALTNHNASFTTLNPCQTCAVNDNIIFTNSTGNGFFLSTNLSSRVNEFLRIDLGMDYYTTEVEFNDRKFFTNIVNDGGSLDKLYLNYQMKPYLDYVNFTVGPSIILFDKLNIGFHFSGGLLIKSIVDYKENLDTDVKFSFTDGSQSYASQNNVNLTDMNSFIIVFSPSISYDYYITENIAITPNVIINLGFSELQKGTNWKMSNYSFSLNATLALSDYVSGNVLPLPDCPDGLIRDIHGNCVPIECPPGMFLNEFGICDCPDGYNKVGNDCEKVEEEPEIAQLASKDCAPNYYFSEATQKCEPLIPLKNTNCKGAYIAIQTNLSEIAENLIEILSSRGFTQFEVEKSSDIIDNRKAIYKVRTSCYPSMSDAYKARKEISNLLQDKDFLEFQNLSVEIIIEN